MDSKHLDPHLHYISVTAIIHKNAKFLITKRSPNEKFYPNVWTVPGGKVSSEDYINTPKTTGSAWYNAMEVALRREIKEEVNLEIDNIRFLVDMTIITYKGPAVVLSYWADYKSGEVKLDEEATEYKWVTKKEAEGYEFIPGIYEEIVMVDKLLKGADPSTVKFEPRKY